MYIYFNTKEINFEESDCAILRTAVIHGTMRFRGLSENQKQA